MPIALDARQSVTIAAHPRRPERNRGALGRIHRPDRPAAPWISNAASTVSTFPCAKAITIDAKLDDWKGYPAFYLDRIEQVQQMKTWWAGPEDLFGQGPHGVG